MDYKRKVLVAGIVGVFSIIVTARFSVDLQAAERGEAKRAVIKRFDKFQELPITAITPRGWLRLFLENQRDGLTGHQEVTGWPFNTRGWTGGEAGKGPHEHDSYFWGAYEQTGYWIDGMIRCGYLLRDDFLTAKAKTHIEYVLTHPAENGYLGPVHVDNLWPRAVFFRALMAEYSATGDKRILEALQKHYLVATTSKQHGGGWRNVCNVEEICWLYGLTGNRRLLDYAIEAHGFFCARNSSTATDNLLAETKTNDHGVWYSETAKLPAILYVYTGERRLLEAAINGFKKVDRDHMLIDGIPSCNEGMAGKIPRICHETCVTTDYPWSVGYLLMATGEVEWADRIERACFNAGIGSVTKDFKAHQYFSSPNQVLATRNSNRKIGSDRMSYRPAHECECCTGNVNRFMPNYVSRMWLSDGSGGLVAALYGPSSVRARVGKDSQLVTIVEKTDYPFSEIIEFHVRAPRKVRFPLWLRIPGWCEQATVSVNGRAVKHEIQSGSFVKLDREFSPNDRVVVSLPVSLKLSHWPQGGVGIERGPLAFSLLIEEDWQVARDAYKSTEEFPAWNTLPSSPWNYALAIDETRLHKDVEIIHHPMTPNPWSIDDAPAPIELRVPARRVQKWTFLGANVHPRYYDKDAPSEAYVLQTPDLPDPETLVKRLGEKVETITLVPYGCTHLRLTIFPHCQKE